MDYVLIHILIDNIIRLNTVKLVILASKIFNVFLKNIISEFNIAYCKLVNGWMHATITQQFRIVSKPNKMSSFFFPSI